MKKVLLIVRLMSNYYGALHQSRGLTSKTHHLDVPFLLSLKNLCKKQSNRIYRTD